VDCVHDRVSDDVREAHEGPPSLLGKVLQPSADSLRAIPQPDEGFVGHRAREITRRDLTKRGDLRVDVRCQLVATPELVEPVGSGS
jgi:hypothetical protein